ncbi:MAG: recombinase family protein [Christensenellaceae bacterium]|nr:recombinase family protein [Christensenellaceae bacterium]
MQRSILRPWAEKQGFEIVGDLVEDGVSGYKISAEKRDAVIEMKAMASRVEFDVLGIYMSDRLGWIADETPLIVSFLNAHGIKVLSYSDGEISAMTRSDKLMTYIRFCQAEGESLKTSIRIKDANEKGVEQGKCCVGCPPFGYRSVSNGTLNFKGRPVFDVEIDPNAAEVVKLIFKLYIEHNSTKRIAKLLNDRGVSTREGRPWGATSVCKILKNKQYLGLYELGKASGKIIVVSPIMEHLRFLNEDVFYEAQAMIKNNFILTHGDKRIGKRPTIKGSRMLQGLVYCKRRQKCTAHTQVYRKTRQDGTEWVHEYRHYLCGSHRHPMEGQCTMKPIKTEMLEKTIADDAK